MKLIISPFNFVENNHEILNDESPTQTGLINLFKDKGMMCCPRNSNRINDSTENLFSLQKVIISLEGTVFSYE